MSADWTTCSVVRDRDGDLWGAPNSAALCGRWNRIGSAPLKLRAAWSDELETAYAPLTPVLDADGQPVVRTVGDLTARHIGRGVRVDGFEGELVALVALFDGIVTVEVLTDDDLSDPRRCTIDTPCEVLP